MAVLRMGLPFLVCSLIANSSCMFSSDSRTIENAFTNIYTHGLWGVNEQGEGHSGDGSMVVRTEVYRKFLQDFMKDHNIQSVVDIGCGDWEFSQHMDWTGVNYTGFDVVKYVIERNKQKFSSPNISFFHADMTKFEAPRADLLICKDVLQHLPHEDIFSISAQFPKFKYCLITNDVDPETFTSKNVQIPPGWYRPVDLTKPPFNFKAEKVLLYTSCAYFKQVICIKNY